MQMLPQKLEGSLSKASATALVLLLGDQVVHAVGDLSAAVVDTLHDALRSYWSDASRQEFNRYVGLNLDGRFHLIFAQFLSQGDDLLGLVYPIQTPLVRVRQDMTNILRSILEGQPKDPNGNQPLEQSLQFEVKQSPQSEKAFHEMEWRPERDQHIVQDEEITVPEESNQTAGKPNSRDADSRKRYLTFGAPFRPHNRKTPPPDDPEESNVMMDDPPWQPLDEGWMSHSEQPDNHLNGVESSDLQRNQTFHAMEDIPEAEEELVNILHDDFIPEKEIQTDQGWLLSSRDQRVDEAQESLTALEEPLLSTAHQTNAEQTDELISDVTIYLVPRHDEQYLVGELSHRLKSWMRSICKKYGWQLAFLSVRPDYIKWTLGDFPESLLREMLTLVRKETSRRIFHSFPELQKKKIQGVDYWAPGYLVDLQNQEFTTQALLAHVAKTRLSGDKEN